MKIGDKVIIIKDIKMDTQLGIREDLSIGQKAEVILVDRDHVEIFGYMVRLERNIDTNRYKHAKNYWDVWLNENEIILDLEYYRGLKLKEIFNEA